MKTKTFDCVEMKHQIQQKIREATADFSTEEKRRWTEKQILSDPVLSLVWTRAYRIHSSEHSMTPK